MPAFCTPHLDITFLCQWIVVAAYNSITTPRVQVVLLLLVAFLLNPFPASSSFTPFLTNLTYYDYYLH